MIRPDRLMHSIQVVQDSMFNYVLKNALYRENTDLTLMVIVCKHAGSTKFRSYKCQVNVSVLY